MRDSTCIFVDRFYITKLPFLESAHICFALLVRAIALSCLDYLLIHLHVFLF